MEGLMGQYQKFNICVFMVPEEKLRMGQKKINLNIQTA